MRKMSLRMLHVLSKNLKLSTFTLIAVFGTLIILRLVTVVTFESHHVSAETTQKQMFSKSIKVTITSGMTTKNPKLKQEPIDQNWTDHVTIEGKLNSSRKYAVFSFTIDNANAHDYMFYAPLTALAWKRIGFDSIIMIVGSVDKWLSDPICQHIRSTCLELEAILIQIYAPPTNAITISQVGRIFAANILSTSTTDNDFVYIITSDSDLWPLSADIYNLQSDMAILSINSECCGNFAHRNSKYKMLPMSNIGMRLITWNRITNENGSNLSKSTRDILTFLEKEFGDVARKPTVKGENQGWYLDQHTISILIKNWTDLFGIAHVNFVPRSTRKDRIDRSRWKGDSKLDGMVDAHMPLTPYLLKTWNQITPLLGSMYGFSSDNYNWSTAYFENYTKLMNVTT